MTIQTQTERVRKLNSRAPDPDARYVLCVVDQSLRAWQNPAVDFAVGKADQLDCPVLAVIALDASDEDTNARQWHVRLEALGETKSDFHDRGIKLICVGGDRPDCLESLIGKATCVVIDAGYLRGQRQWRSQLARSSPVAVWEVEGNVVIPAAVASDKAEYMAKQFRDRIDGCLDDFLVQSSDPRPRKSSLPLHETGDIEIGSAAHLAKSTGIEMEKPPALPLRPGRAAALDQLDAFVSDGLPHYADGRTDPARRLGSGLSAALHFGFISPIEVGERLKQNQKRPEEAVQAFLEELVVRRELAVNYVVHQPEYYSYAGLPDWARETLQDHADDEREQRYTRAELENAETGDNYWNAAMREMLLTGLMHNYMRMYWGKQILAWCNTPQYAYRLTLEFNNRYFIDGNDPSSYANVSWIFGLHDRPWPERPVFGKVRPMTRSGLERKFDMERYVDWVNRLKG